MSKLNLITENLLIAASPVIGYLLALCYEFGYLQYYQLPFNLIEITIEKALAVTLVFLLNLIVINYLILSISLTSDSKETAKTFHIKVSLFLLAVCIASAIFSYGWQIGAIVFAFICLMVLLIAAPKLTSKGKFSFMDCIYDEFVSAFSTPIDSGLSLIAKIQVWLICSMFLFGLISFIGYANAEKTAQKRDYSYSTEFDGNSYSLVRIYGSNQVFVQLDSSGNSGENILIKTSNPRKPLLLKRNNVIEDN